MIGLRFPNPSEKHVSPVMEFVLIFGLLCYAIAFVTIALSFITWTLPLTIARITALTLLLGLIVSRINYKAWYAHEMQTIFKKGMKDE